jgi:hypothetical protein
VLPGGRGVESRNKKMAKSLPNHYVFCFVFYCCCAFKYHAAANFFIGGCESFENGRGFLVFGVCGRECLSGPGSTERDLSV